MASGPTPGGSRHSMNELDPTTTAAVASKRKITLLEQMEMSTMSNDDKEPNSRLSVAGTLSVSTPCLSDTDTISKKSMTLSIASTASRSTDRRTGEQSGFRAQHIQTVMMSVRSGDYEKLNELMNKIGSDGVVSSIQAHDGKNNSALHYAALNDDVEMVEFLLKHGAVVNDPGEGGKRPLHFALIMKHGGRSESAQNFQMDILRSNATYPDSQSAPDRTDVYQIPELSEAIDPPPAASHRHHKFRFGLKRNKHKHDKRSAMSVPELRVDPEEGRVEEATSKPSMMSSNQSLNKEKVVVAPVEQRKNEPTAEARGGVVEVLLAAGADCTVKDFRDMTPLHLAALTDNVNAINCFVAHGASVNARDRRGMTPLSHACKSGSTDAALLLIKYGANLLNADVNGDTAMHLAVRHAHTMIVMALIEQADSTDVIFKVMLQENSKGVIPLYDAVKSGNKELFTLCLNNVSQCGDKSSQVRMEDLVNFAGENDDALLHVAARAGHVGILELLIIHGASVNRVNHDAQTPLHIACAQNSENIALCLIEHGADANAADGMGHNPLQVAVKHGSFQTLMTLLQFISASAGGQSDEATEILKWTAHHNKADILRKILDYDIRYHEMTDDGIMDFIMAAVKKKHKETVQVLIRWNRAVVDHTDTLGNTPLHYAAEGGHEAIAEALLKAKAPVNAKNSSDLGEESPLHYAAARGWTRTARVLIDYRADINQPDSHRMTPLHHACKHGQINMVELLLFGKGTSEVFKAADIALCDADELNCLDHAIDNGHESITKIIISHDRWREVMSVSSVDDDTTYRTTPMRKLIRFMPDMARMVLDRCITVTGGRTVRDTDVKIEFYYELLEDAFSPWMKAAGDIDKALLPNGSVVNALLNRVYKHVSTRLVSDIDQQYDEEDKLLPSSKPYVIDSHERNEYHPLQMMVSFKRVELLDHPLVTTLLRHKWNAMGRYIFYLSFLLYITFLAMLTGYILVIPPNYYVRTVNKTVDTPTVEWYADGQARWIDDISTTTLLFFDALGPQVIILLSTLNVFREVGQMFVQRGAYLKSFSNFLELFMYVVAVLFAMPFSQVQYTAGGHIKRPWQWPLGGVAGFLGWLNLLLFLRGNSNLGIYVIMFIDIFKTFLRFGLILLLFIVAFGLGFYVFLMNQNPFHTFFDSMMKTFVMMIGELDYADIFFGQDYLGTSNTLETDGEAAFFMNASFCGFITQLFFSLFLIVMSILMMNMLVGLAVDDIQAIQLKAKLHRLTMQVDMVLETQAKFPLWLWRRSVARKKTFLLHETKLKKWLRVLTGGRKQLKRALQIRTDTEDRYTIENAADEAFEKIRERLKNVSWRVEHAVADMQETSRTRETQIEQVHTAQETLRDRTELLHSTQERMGDRVELLHRKMDVMLKKLKVKNKKVEQL